MLNEEIFSSDVPNRIPGNLALWTGAPQPTQSEYSVENLDLSGNFTPGDTVNLGIIGHPELTYYHRWSFIPHPESNTLLPNSNSTSWYIPDTSFPNQTLYSVARNTISFKKGGEGDYQYVFYIDTLAGPRAVAELETPYKFVFDNQSGYILIYADDDSSGLWKISSTKTSTTGPLIGSFIKYTGPKGASGGGTGGITSGTDASFNNVDISNNLNIVHNGLETGILQSSSFTIPPPIGAPNAGPNEWLIAKVQYDNNPDVNATGYFTLEVNDTTNTNSYLKLNFIAGVITKEVTFSSTPPPPSPTSSSTNTLSTNTVNSQLSVPQQTQTLNIQPTTVNLTPITVRPQPITVQPIQPTLPTQPTQPQPVGTIYIVTVQLVNGVNKFLIDGQVAPQLDFVIGNIYIFDQSDSSNVGHQIQITELPEPGRPVDYSTTTGRPGERDSKVTVTIQQDANKVLYYLCDLHGINMGNQINVLNEEPVTIQPIVDPTPPGVSPIVDSDDEENTLPVTTLSTTSTINSIEFHAFIKVLSCIRRSDGVSPDPGIIKLNIHKGGTNFPGSVLLTVTHDTSIDIGPVNVRLYKNSLNKINIYNELQWSLESQDLSINIFTSAPGTNIVSSWIADKADPPLTSSLSGGGVGGTPPITTLVRPPLYPLHPNEPFTTTSQYTIIDNALNVQKDFNLKGNINLMESGGGSATNNVKSSPKISAPILDLYEHKLFTGVDFKSDKSLSNFDTTGVWQTIATLEATDDHPNDVDQRTGYAMFEIVDRSNPETEYKFQDVLSFIVNFSSVGSGQPNASINLLSSNLTGNTSVYYGYIKAVRVRCGTHRALAPNNNINQAGVNIDILRTSDAPQNSGNTNIRVNMYHNYKRLNTNNEINPFTLTSTGLNFISNVKTAEIDLTIYNHGFATTFGDGASSTFENARFYGITSGIGPATRPSNIIPNSLTCRGDIDMSTYHINNLNYLQINGNLNMKNNSIVEINNLSGGLSGGAYPKITFNNDDINIFVDHDENGKIKIGAGTDVTQQITLNTGGELSLDINDIEMKNTNMISRINPLHGEIENRAFVQEFVIDTSVMSITDGDWINIALSGRYSSIPQSSLVNYGTNPPIGAILGDSILDMKQ